MNQTLQSTWVDSSLNNFGSNKVDDRNKTKLDWQQELRAEDSLTNFYSVEQTIDPVTTNFEKDYSQTEGIKTQASTERHQKRRFG